MYSVNSQQIGYVDSVFIGREATTDDPGNMPTLTPFCFNDLSILNYEYILVCCFSSKTSIPLSYVVPSLFR